jgi:transcriptional regulator with XRE-family HTH domain
MYRMLLGTILKEYCHQKRIGLRPLAKEIGVSHTTLSRFMNGNSVDSDTLKKILLWIL